MKPSYDTGKTSDGRRRYRGRSGPATAAMAISAVLPVTVGLATAIAAVGIP